MSETVDQVLFGYRQGHELLEASCAIPAAQHRQLLPHMDASFENAHEQQLVGAPIPSTDGYLLARIWPAPERPRPGAVWSHGLLLSAKQLRSERLSGLLQLLRRPADERFAGYAEALPWPTPTEGPTTVEPLARALTWATLGGDGDSRVVLWHSAREAEQALVELLDVFPGAARQCLSFRTRERARLGTSPYSIQVATRLGGRPASTSSMVIDARRPPTAVLPDWTSLLDRSEVAGRRRCFLHHYGDDGATTRPQVAALAAIAAWLDGDVKPAGVVRRLVDSFPDPGQVHALRFDLLGPADVADHLWRVVDEDRLAFLLDHGHNFDVAQFDVSRRVSLLWERDQSGALGLAGCALRDDVAEPWRLSLLKAFGDSVGPGDLALLTNIEPLLFQVLERRPELLAEPASWQAVPPAVAAALLDRFAGRLTPEALVAALLDSPAILTLAVDAVPLGIDVAIRNALAQDARPALRALAAHPDFERWSENAELTGREAMLLLEAVPPDQLAGRPSRGWWTVAADLRDRPAGLPTTVLLAAALRDRGGDGDRLLELTFAPVHRALAGEELDGDSWALLDSRLPRPADWDQAGRLRRALVERATTGHWDAERLSSALIGAGPHGARMTDLVSGKHPLRKALNSALNGLADLFR